MKPPSVLPVVGFALALLFVSCGKKETPTEPAAPAAPVAAAPAPPAPKVDPVEVATPPVAIPVEDQSPDEEEPSAPDTDLVQPTPGQRLDHAIEKTGQALQTAGEKTEQGVRTAAEKTEEGLRKAAEKTGGALQRVGETIQKKAE
ncbi:MAG: hypothetical protein CFE26_23220, partial [Verrucomicrobiales bacterium VVV1]